MHDQSTALASFAQPINVVVSGASLGIGFAFVDALLTDRAVQRLFATSRFGASDQALAKLAMGKQERLVALDMDVTDDTSVALAAATMQRATNQIELIINCAGLLHDGPLVQLEKRLADLTRSFNVNAIGPLLVAKHFQALLPRQQRAVFASLCARVGSIADNRLGGWYSYRVSKAAQNMVTRNLSIEPHRRARGIICVALHAGTVDTALSRPFQGKVSDKQLFSPKRAARQLLRVIDGLATSIRSSNVLFCDCTEYRQVIRASQPALRHRLGLNCPPLAQKRRHHVAKRGLSRPKSCTPGYIFRQAPRLRR